MADAADAPPRPAGREAVQHDSFHQLVRSDDADRELAMSLSAASHDNQLTLAGPTDAVAARLYPIRAIWSPIPAACPRSDNSLATFLSSRRTPREGAIGGAWVKAAPMPR